MDFDKAHKACELVASLAVIFGVPVALIEVQLHRTETMENAKRARIDAAERIYLEVDARNEEFVKHCIEHPRLDCYSVPRTDEIKLSADEKVQQAMIYADLSDLFEVVYVRYHKSETNPEVRKLFMDEWQGWDTYIKKFLRRPAFRRVWFEIKDEYDQRFQAYMDTIAPPPKNP
jgi:hypothetical protein